MNNKSLSTAEVRKRLTTGYMGGYRHFLTLDDAGKPIRLDWFIRGLICRDCNSGWARRLEEKTAPVLFNFIHKQGEADEALFRRWAWFFTIKTWFYYARPEPTLLRGMMAPILTVIADPARHTELPTPWLTRIPEEWESRKHRFGFGRRLSATGRRRFWFMLWGVVWIIPADKGMRAPLDSVPLIDGLRRIRVPRGKPARLSEWLAG